EARAAVHSERAAREVLEVVPGRAVRVDARHVDRVTRARRDVLDRQSELNRPAPLVIRVAERFGGAVVTNVVVLGGNRRLEQTPSLVDTDHTDEVRRARATDRTGADTTGENASCRCTAHVEVTSLIVLGNVFSRERGRHALTEVSGVGELVDTS